MSLTRYGLREWLVLTIIAAALSATVVWLGQWHWTIVIGIVWLALVAFFRDPWRRLPPNLKAGDMVSPADGTVSKVFEVEHHDATGGPAKVVRIFLSVLDVHVNRSPFDAEVVSIVHTPGKYLDARSEESAQVNESNLVTLRLRDDRTIGVRQVSGAIARRIVCPLKVGDRLGRGQRFGMIKFGSTTELILPASSVEQVHVAKGMKVVGGVTVLATIAAPAASGA